MKNISPVKSLNFRRKILCLLLFLFTFPSFAQSQGSNISIGTQHRIRSRVLGEERRYIVNLPASYEKDDFYIDKKYPVLFLLDGDTHFHSASGIVRFMSENEQIPEMIVVAVSNTNRARDFTPAGADNFSRFLETELLPQIDKNYRTLPFRLLVGHSLGGLFAVDSFLGRKVFNAYLAIDPTLTWDDSTVVKKARAVLTGNESFETALYLSQANNPFNEGRNAGARGEAFRTFNEILAKNRTVRYGFYFFENEDHFSVPLQSLYHGLLFIFEGYKFPLNVLSNKTADDIRKHYKELFRRLGVDLQPPGKLLNNVALFLLHNEKKHDPAIDLLKLNREYYPLTFVTSDSLGDAYRVKGDNEKAILNYKKSLELNPANENAKKAIKELTPK